MNESFKRTLKSLEYALVPSSLIRKVHEMRRGCPPDDRASKWWYVGAAVGELYRLWLYGYILKEALSNIT